MSKVFQRGGSQRSQQPIPAPTTPSVSGAGSTLAPTTSLSPVPRPERLRQTVLPNTVPRPVARPENLEQTTQLAAPETSLRPQPRPTQEAEEAAEQQGSDSDPECATGECSTCDLVTVEQLGTFFTGATDVELSDLAEGLNFNITDGKIDTHLRISHFLGQVKEEVGANITLRENLNYSTLSRLQQMFSHFRRNPNEGTAVLRVPSGVAREEAIANIVYMDANRSPGYELGNTEAGDGWRYRGRGLKQLTGRYNYHQFTAGHTAIWGEEIDFVANPDKVSEPKYSVRSGLWFWVDRNCYALAGGGMTRAVSESITDKINRGVNAASRTNRWNFSNQIYGSDVLKQTCWNRSWVNSNSDARIPAAGGP